MPWTGFCGGGDSSTLLVATSTHMLLEPETIEFPPKLRREPPSTVNANAALVEVVELEDWVAVMLSVSD